MHTGAAEFEGLQTLRYVLNPSNSTALTIGFSYADLSKAVDRLASYYSTLNIPLPSTEEVPPEQVIAVLTSTAIDESLLEIALAKLGLSPLLLSLNNSVAAVAHLCKQTKSTHLIYGPKYAATAQEAQVILEKEGLQLTLVPERRFPLWGKGGVTESKIPPFKARLAPQQEMGRTCVILHSSGSTGFPKPVYITHYGLVANAATSIPSSGFSALPLFHGFGHFSM